MTRGSQDVNFPGPWGVAFDMVRRRGVFRVGVWLLALMFLCPSWAHAEDRKLFVIALLEALKMSAA
jgi:hypothetical protein